jgi:hypothetical protein
MYRIKRTITDLFTTCISRLSLTPLQAVEMNGKFRTVAHLLIYSNYPTNAQSWYLRSYITLEKEEDCYML